MAEMIEAPQPETLPKFMQKPNPRGRPLKFRSNVELQRLIDGFFTECDVNKKVPTMSRLAYALGVNRETLINYGAKEEYSSTIERAKALIESRMEDLLLDKNYPTAGVIFALVNNNRWVNKLHTDNRNLTQGIIKIEFDKN